MEEAREKVLRVDWDAEETDSVVETVETLHLPPSLSFALESALLQLLSPLRRKPVKVCAFLMGSPSLIVQEAAKREREGFTVAKLKVAGLSLEEAYPLVKQLQERFRLRIDVNRSWSQEESSRFFERFPPGSFDFIEEPFPKASDFRDFPHPLAIDESFPDELSLKDLEELPNLKALIYKPTLQGGLKRGRALKEWADKRGVSLVISSSFESDAGHLSIAELFCRLSLTEPAGIGTYHYLKRHTLPLLLQGAKIDCK